MGSVVMTLPPRFQYSSIQELITQPCDVPDLYMSVEATRGRVLGGHEGTEHSSQTPIAAL